MSNRLFKPIKSWAWSRITFWRAASAVLLLLILVSLIPGRDILGEVPLSRSVTDRDGVLLRVFITEDEKYRVYRHISDFPPTFIEAILLQEDRHFYRHPGVNPVALIRAAWETYGRRERRVGGSTITMQLARMRYGFPSNRIPGKIRQIFTAFRLELFHNKQEILEAYLNLVPCGGNIEGFPAAAFYYFNKDVSDLTLSEQLLLAVVPQDPNARSPEPGNYSAELLKARSVLANAWIETHPGDADVADTVSMPVRVQNSFPFKAPHFAEYVTSGSSASGDTVVSTINSELQELARRELVSYIERRRNYGVSNGAVFIGNYETMEVLSAVGSADFFDTDIQGEVNGFNSRRSPGSTLKPFVYGLAMDNGLITPDTILKDTPGSFSEYTPDNYRSDFQGAAPAWKALVDSRNIPAITLESQLGDDKLYHLLDVAGVGDLKDEIHYGLSIVLGSAELSMMELSALYAMLANDGVFRPWKTRRVDIGTDISLQDAGKNSDAKGGGVRKGAVLLSPEAAWLTLDMLTQNPPPFETRPQDVEGIPVAFKTGTSIGFKDAWSVAVTGPYVIAVWIGNFDGQGNNAFIGRRMATPLLFEIIDNLLSRHTETLRFWKGIPPGNLRKVPVCSVSGRLVNDYCPDTVQGWFIPGVSPIKKCEVHREVFIDTATGYRTDDRDGIGVERQVREFWTSDMLELFEAAGLPRLTAPLYPPDTNRDDRHNGFPPDILHPLGKTEYILDKRIPRYASIPLSVSVDADVSEIFWFADNRFIGKCKPGTIVTWSPDPGEYSVTVVDDSGRSDTVEIVVVSQESVTN